MNKQQQYKDLLTKLTEDLGLPVLDAYKKFSRLPKNTKSYDNYVKHVKKHVNRITVLGKSWITIVNSNGKLFDVPADEKYINLVKDL